MAAFPLLLLLATILGYALHGNPHLQRQVLDSALAQFPVIGGQITANIRSFHGSTGGLVIGILGYVYGGLGIVQAVQNTLNKVWAVPRDSRPNPVRARLRSLLLLAFGGASVLLTTEERVCDRVLQHPDADRQGDPDAAHDGKALLWVHRAWNHRSFGVKGLGERGTQDAVVRLGQAG